MAENDRVPSHGDQDILLDSALAQLLGEYVAQPRVIGSVAS